MRATLKRAWIIICQKRGAEAVPADFVTLASVDAFFTKYNARKQQNLGMSPEQKSREGLNLQEAI